MKAISAVSRRVAEDAEEGLNVGGSSSYQESDDFTTKDAEENLNSGGRNACCKSDKGCLAPVPIPSA